MTPSILLRRAFCSCVLLLALWRFSENTADPDLWGHVLFGQRMIHLGHLETAEPFSWTAPGYRWINHEIGAELIMGATHLALGGTGLLLLAIFTGLFTFLLALKMGSENLKWPERATAWVIGLIAAKEIAYGFSCRPQIFTAVALVVMFWILRKPFCGNLKYAALLPILFFLWINTHGGALAGLVLLAVACLSITAQKLFHSFRLEKMATYLQPAASGKLLWVLWLALTLSVAALFVNPYGTELIRWLVGSVSWFRPEISEWNPPQFGAEHAGYFALMALSSFAFVFSSKKRAVWEVAVLIVLATISIRHARHIPLFSIATLAFVPSHLSSALMKFESRAKNLRFLFSQQKFQLVAATFLLFSSGLIALAIVAYKKERFYTIEVPADEYPLNALEFIKKHGIQGKMLSFFDWGEQSIWELPESPVSIDGRLDTCYPRPLLREHWNFYDGKPVDRKILDVSQADFALLRSDVVGILTLKHDPAWTVVYQDPLSVVLVRNLKQFRKLQDKELPVTTPLISLSKRDPFPKQTSLHSRVE
jgi:hypothetical protein